MSKDEIIAVPNLMIQSINLIQQRFNEGREAEMHGYSFDKV